MCAKSGYDLPGVTDHRLAATRRRQRARFLQPLRASRLLHHRHANCSKPVFSPGSDRRGWAEAGRPVIVWPGKRVPGRNPSSETASKPSVPAVRSNPAGGLALPESIRSSSGRAGSMVDHRRLSSWLNFWSRRLPATRPRNRRPDLPRLAVLHDQRVDTTPVGCSPNVFRDHVLQPLRLTLTPCSCSRKRPEPALVGRAVPCPVRLQLAGRRPLFPQPQVDSADRPPRYSGTARVSVSGRESGAIRPVQPGRVRPPITDFPTAVVSRDAAGVG